MAQCRSVISDFVIPLVWQHGDCAGQSNSMPAACMGFLQVGDRIRRVLPCTAHGGNIPHGSAFAAGLGTIVVKHHQPDGLWSNHCDDSQTLMLLRIL